MTRRARSASFDAVLALQFDEPGAVWDGTWPRAPEERRPVTGATVFADYDPNWRQFIGCVLGILARDFAQVLGPSRCERIEAAIARAIRGEGSDRIIATYTNIALMQAWLLAEYGDRAHGERLAATVEDLYRDEAGFREFNSPTYYGVDLWALALWRRSGSSSLAAAGQRLEAALWRDIAAFYHAGLRNLCGPFDRAYGMDMTRYASLLGLWLWWTCGDAMRRVPRPEASVRARARLLRDAAARAGAAADRGRDPGGADRRPAPTEPSSGVVQDERSPRRCATI